MSHCGGKIKWSDKLNTLIPDESKQAINEQGQGFVTVLGSAKGQFWPSELFGNMEKIITNICEIFNLQKIKPIPYKLDKIVNRETSSIFTIPDYAT